MHIILGMFVFSCFRLGSGAGGSITFPIPLLKLQTLHKEPNTAPASGPTPAMMSGSTTQMADIVPIPAPEPFPVGALRGTRNNYTSFQYSSNLSAGVKEFSIVIKENAIATWYPNSIKFNHCSELFNHCQELFHHYSELYYHYQELFYLHYQECDLSSNPYSD